MKNLLRRLKSPIVLIPAALLLGLLLALGVQHRHKVKMKLKHLAAILFVSHTALSGAGAGRAQAPAPTAFAQDNFTTSADTPLASYKPFGDAAISGTQNWARVTALSTGTATVSAANGDVYGATTDNQAYYDPIAPASADYDAEGDFVVKSVPTVVSFASVLARQNAATNTGYALSYIAGNGLNYWQFGWNAGGSNGTVGSTLPMTLSPGLYHGKISLRGSTVAAYVTNVSTGVTSTVAIGTDTHVAAAGYAGVGFYNFAGSNTTGIHIDNFTASAAPVQTYNLWFVGNSLTQGAHSTPGNDYPSVCMRLLGPAYGTVPAASATTPYNLGIGGATIATVPSPNPSGYVTLTSGAAAVDSHLSGSLPNILVVWECSNELAENPGVTTATSTEAAFKAYCLARRAAGWKVIVLTVLPRQLQPTMRGDDEAARQTINTWMRANWPSFSDGEADVAADARIGYPGTEANGTYYYNPGSGLDQYVHLVDAGYAIVANYVAQAVSRLTAASSVARPKRTLQ